MLLRSAVIFVLIPGAIACCAGCQGPAFTRERFVTVYLHEPAEQVRAKLGEPARSTPEYWDYVNRKPTHYEARIWFRDGQVAKKEWFERKELFKDGE
jgi:hypothetical protein